MTHQWIEEEIEMTHQWIEEMEFKEMIYEQIGWSESELELHCRAWGHRTEASSAKHQRPLASDFSWQFANRKISRGYSLAVAFAVCSSRLNGRKGFQQ